MSDTGPRTEIIPQRTIHVSAHDLWEAEDDAQKRLSEDPSLMARLILDARNPDLAALRSRRVLERSLRDRLAAKVAEHLLIKEMASDLAHWMVSNEDPNRGDWQPQAEIYFGARTIE